jgi:hypothetical protein
MRRLIALLAVLPWLAAAQERPSQHPYLAPILAEGAESHYRFTLPAAAYRGVARRDVGDLRVFNAAGEPVPYAFARPDAETPAAAEVHTAKLFPLYGDKAKGLEATAVRVQRTSRGTVVNVSVSGAPPASHRLLGYLIDAAEFKAPKEALLLQWETREGFSGAVRVDGSDDFKQWSALVADAPVLFLEHRGARLERNRVELGGARAKYLRASFSGVPDDFALKDVRIELRADRVEPARERLSLIGEEVKGRRGEYLFDTGGRFPVDRLRLALPQPNTVAQVQFLTRERAEDPWRAASSATVYRMRRNGADVENPDIRVAVNPNRYWMLRADLIGGGLGAGEVRMEIGWLPHEVLFAARGAAPFTLAYGSKAAKPGAIALNTVLPGYREGDLSATKLAVVGEISGAGEPRPVLRDPLQFLRNAAESGEAKKWALWAALVVGVLLLAWMAFRLMRELRKHSG